MTLERWGDRQGTQERPLAGGDAGVKTEMVRKEDARTRET